MSRPYDSLALIMMARGFMPSNVYNANSLVFTKVYAEGPRRVTVTAEVDRPGPFGRSTKLAQFRVSVETILAPTDVAEAPVSCREDLEGIVAALQAAPIELPTVTCVLCGALAAQFYVDGDQILCTHCRRDGETV